MSNRKPSNSGMSGEPTNAQDNSNAMYTAHQVHTLANLIYRQMAGSWAGHAGWPAMMTAPMSQPPFASGFPMMPDPTAMGMGMTPGNGSWVGAPGYVAPPALFYWYP
jgi:hypothetical protein